MVDGEAGLGDVDAAGAMGSADAVGIALGRAEVLAAVQGGVGLVVHLVGGSHCEGVLVDGGWCRSVALCVEVGYKREQRRGKFWRGMELGLESRKESARIYRGQVAQPIGW